MKDNPSVRVVPPEVEDLVEVSDEYLRELEELAGKLEAEEPTNDTPKELYERLIVWAMQAIVDSRRDPECGPISTMSLIMSASELVNRYEGCVRYG